MHATASSVVPVNTMTKVSAPSPDRTRVLSVLSVWQLF